MYQAGYVQMTQYRVTWNERCATADHLTLNCLISNDNAPGVRTSEEPLTLPVHHTWSLNSVRYPAGTDKYILTIYIYIESVRILLQLQPGSDN